MYNKNISLNNKIYRYAWNIAYVFIFKYSPIYLFKWRVLILKIFGAEVSWTSKIYPKCTIWSPNNLIIKEKSCISNYVFIYNVSLVIIDKYTVISHNTEICTATKNYKDNNRYLMVGDIIIGNNCWIASNVFIGPGVSIGNNSVILARVNLLKSIPDNTRVKIKDNNEYTTI